MEQAVQSRIYKDVKFLTTLCPFRNYKNLVSLEKSCEYISTEFRNAGLTPEKQQWKVYGETYSNIVAKYNPEAKKRLIVGAHYDVCGDTPGADDNASAVAGMLETARLIAHLNPDLDYGVDFVAFCLEEPPFFTSDRMGSYIHANSLLEAEVDVIGMICYEMIGYFSEEAGSQMYPDPMLAQQYPDKGNFIIVVGLEAYRSFTEKVYQAMKSRNSIPTEVIHFPRRIEYAALSDHFNYWDCGYPAVMINDTSFLRNPHYHKLSDTIDTLDFDKITKVVDAVYEAVVNF